MRPGLNGEIILEGETEARVTAHMLTAVGMPSAAGLIEPPVEQPHIGWLDFVARRIEDKIGTGDKTEHVIDAAIAAKVSEAITSAAIGSSVLFAPIPLPLQRRAFLVRQVGEYHRQLQIGTTTE